MGTQYRTCSRGQGPQTRPMTPCNEHLLASRDVWTKELQCDLLGFTADSMTRFLNNLLTPFKIFFLILYFLNFFFLNFVLFREEDVG